MNVTKIAIFSVAVALSSAAILVQEAYSANSGQVTVPAVAAPAPGAAVEHPTLPAAVDPASQPTVDAPAPDANAASSATTVPAGQTPTDHISMPVASHVPAPVAAAFHADSYVVRVAQRALASAGAYQGDITGIADQATVAAIQQFQIDHGLKPTGIADYNLIAYLRTGKTIGEVNADLAQQNWNTSACSPMPPRWVKWTQSLLASRQVYTGDDTGVLDQPTRDAIAKYEELAGLKITGCVSPVLLHSLLQTMPDAPAPTFDDSQAPSNPPALAGRYQINPGPYSQSAVADEPTFDHPRHLFARQGTDPGHPWQPDANRDDCPTFKCPDVGEVPDWRNAGQGDAAPWQPVGPSIAAYVQAFTWHPITH